MHSLCFSKEIEGLAAPLLRFYSVPPYSAKLVDLRGVFQGQLLEGAKGTPLFWARVGSIFGMSAASTSSSAKVVGMPKLAKKARAAQLQMLDLANHLSFSSHHAKQLK